MILRLLRSWGARRPYYPICGADGTLYMARWWLLGGSNERRDEDAGRPTPRTWERGAIDAWVGRHAAARLHHIAREDRARDFHCHPFTFLSVIVSGWYVERLPRDQGQDPLLDVTRYRDVVRRPGSVAFRRATDRHTIVEVSPGGVWTVCALSSHWKPWGFHTGAGFVPWRQYGSAP